MIAECSFLILMLVAIVYPLCLFISGFSNPVGRGFTRFQLSLSFFLGLFAFLVYSSLNSTMDETMKFVLWFALLLVFIALDKRSGKLHFSLVALPSIFGLLIFLSVVSNEKMFFIIDGPNWSFWVSSILGSVIVSTALYSMILGHWYLNVVNLSISYLRRATNVLMGLLTIHLFWIIFTYVQIGTKDSHASEIIRAGLFSIESIFLLPAHLFGVLFPLILTVMTLKTIQIHSTQSATGLLYVNISSILIGEIIYRYYALQHGIFL